MSEPHIREIDQHDTAAVNAFTRLERQFHGNKPNFISEIDDDVINCLSGRSSFYQEVEHALFIASDGNTDIARCTAIINKRYQQAKNEAVGFIGHFAALPDNDSRVIAMLKQAENWLQQRGVRRIIAPYNGSALLGMALRTADFEQEPMFPFGWQPPYYQNLLQDAGYQASYPLWYFTIDFTDEQYRSQKQRVEQLRASRNNITIRPINKKRWDEELETYRLLFNAAFIDEWEFHPQSADEFHEFFDQMKPILDPQQMLIAEVDDTAAGFCMGMPDWTPLFRSFKGKMGIIQILKLMLRSRHYNRAGLLGIGVLPQHTGSGLAQMLAVSLYDHYESLGLKQAFYYPVNDRNITSRKFAERLGGTGKIMYHCYDKVLS